MGERCTNEKRRLHKKAIKDLLFRRGVRVRLGSIFPQNKVQALSLFLYDITFSTLVTTDCEQKSVVG
jgi:hypothetical protein